MFRKNIINIAVKHDIDLIKITEKEIELYEKNKEKVWKFIKEVRQNYNNKIRFIELSQIGMDRDVKGNTLEGSKSLYLLDRPFDEQLSLF